MYSTATERGGTGGLLVGQDVAAFEDAPHEDCPAALGGQSGQPAVPDDAFLLVGPREVVAHVGQRR